MHHSIWDLEVHARDMHQRRVREANRARQIAEARVPGDHAPFSKLRDRFARLVSLAESWLSFQWALTLRPAVSIGELDQVNSGLRMPLADESQVRTVIPPSRLCDPYAGMTVVARRMVPQTAEQPCSITDC